MAVMAELITGLTVERVRANLGEVRERIAAAAARAGSSADDVELVVAGKYLALEDLGVLAEAGIALVGENRAQDLEAKVAAYGDTLPGTSSAICRAARSRSSPRSCG